ncbi:MAG: M4 family metallopeptidase, partial [Synergistaceae bacterium]|nr:M4 family metallopeptidase [Synergistaceae bacterium]
PVVEQNNAFFMVDLNLNLYVVEYGADTVSSDTKYFSDREQVSAYTNMREIMQWWKSFGRDSLDGNGGRVKIVTHTSELGWEDNAGWVSSEEAIYVFTKLKCKYSPGADIGVLTHETQHGVMHYIVGDIGNSGRQGAISEGYADIFACLKNRHWKIADVQYNTEIDGIKYNCLRNVADPYDTNSLTGWELANNKIDTTETHVKGLLAVTRAAYLMHEDNPAAQNGLTWDELGKVWYNAMYQGLWSKHEVSYGRQFRQILDMVTYDDVRRCVLNAAKELAANGELSANKISAIEEAFNTIGSNISGTYTVSSSSSANLKGKVTDASTGQPLSGYKVSVYSKPSYSTPSANATPSVFYAQSESETRSESYLSKLIQKVRTFLTEYFTMKLSKGSYTVSFSKEGYKTYSAEVAIGDVDVELNVSLSLSADIPVVSEDIPIDEAHFPDERFRNYLRRNHDIDKDGILSKAEIANVTVMNFSGNATNSLQGIKYFVALQEIHCANSWLTSLDLSGCTALNKLYCRFNSLIYLDVSGCTSLQILDCPANSLTTLKLNGCTALSELECSSNQLTSIDVSQNAALECLRCD